MSSQWTGDFIGKLHNNGITAKDFSSYLGIHPKYVSKILNGKCSPKNSEQRFNQALEEMIKIKSNDKKKETTENKPDPQQRQ